MRFLNSNRKTYEKLELLVTRTKHTLGPTSNRGKNALHLKYPARFRTSPSAQSLLPAPVARCLLASDCAPFLIGTRIFSHFLLTIMIIYLTQVIRFVSLFLHERNPQSRFGLSESANLTRISSVTF